MIVCQVTTVIPAEGVILGELGSSQALPVEHHGADAPDICNILKGIDLQPESDSPAFLVERCRATHPVPGIVPG